MTNNLKYINYDKRNNAAMTKLMIISIIIL